MHPLTTLGQRLFQDDDLAPRRSHSITRTLTAIVRALTRPSLATRQQQAARRALRLALYDCIQHDDAPLYVGRVEALRKVVEAMDAERRGGR